MHVPQIGHVSCGRDLPECAPATSYQILPLLLPLSRVLCVPGHLQDLKRLLEGVGILNGFGGDNAVPLRGNSQNKGER